MDNTITNKKLNNHICLIILRKDEFLIRNNQFEKLNQGLQGILKTLSQNKNIKIITLGIIKNKKAHLHPKDYSELYNILKNRIYKLLSYIDYIDAWINNYALRSKNQLTDKEKKIIIDKIEDSVILNQEIKSFYSFTSLEESKKLTNNFDFFIRGSGLKIERGEILNQGSKIGVVSLHHGDNLLNRGSPPGFWEVYLKENSGITVQVLTNELDGGDVIYRAKIKTIPNAKANCTSIYNYTSVVLEIAINKIYNLKLASKKNIFKNEFYHPIKPYFREIFKIPNPLLQLSISLRNLNLSIISLVKKIFKKFVSLLINPYEKWGVAFTSNKNLRFTNWNHLKSENKNDWFADPFFTKVDGKLFILTEKYIFKKRKGVIFANPIEFKNNKYSIKKGSIILENKYHLSYPFTFTKNNRSFLIPENNINGCYLYELSIKRNSSSQILKTKKLKKLLNGYCTDATLYSHEGFDYLFVSRVAYNSDSVLNVYFTPDILNTDLQKHPSSPLVLDCDLGRSAGRIFKDKSSKKIIRPSQIGNKMYGEGIIFSELIICKDYIQMKSLNEKIKIPKDLKKYSKTHHIENFENIIALDYS